MDSKSRLVNFAYLHIHTPIHTCLFNLKRDQGLIKLSEKRLKVAIEITLKIIERLEKEIYLAIDYNLKNDPSLDLKSSRFPTSFNNVLRGLFKLPVTLVVLVELKKSLCEFHKKRVKRKLRNWMTFKCNKATYSH